LFGKLHLRQRFQCFEWLRVASAGAGVTLKP
jgi:hypothetical protein